MDKRAESRKLALEALNESPSAALFHSPIDYIFADHFRQRSLCRIIDEIGKDETADLEKIAAVLQFLKNDFGLHIIDEEEDLFPHLRRRADAEDCIEDVLCQLSQEHADHERDAGTIADGLANILTAKGEYPISTDFHDLLARFAANERRHLTLENAIILPLARARLTPSDLLNIGKRMAARRGLDFPE